MQEKDEQNNKKRKNEENFDEVMWEQSNNIHICMFKQHPTAGVASESEFSMYSVNGNHTQWLRGGRGNRGKRGK